MHFSVLVVGEDIEGQMAPFQENNMGDCPEEYMEFSVELEYKDAKEEYDRESTPDETLDEYVKRVHHFEEKDKDGNYGYKYNSNAQWDWFVVGGRWQDDLRLKNGKRAISARKGDVLFKCEDLRKYALSKWREFMSKKNKWKRLTSESQLRASLGILDKDTKEQYVSRESEFGTYAVLMNGEWYSKDSYGETAWVEKIRELWKKIDEDDIITVVDCHT